MRRIQTKDNDLFNIFNKFIYVFKRIHSGEIHPSFLSIKHSQMETYFL